MEKFFTNNYRLAVLIIKYGLILSGTVIVIVIPPPVENFANAIFIKALVIFIMVFLAISMEKYKKKKYKNIWIRLGITTLILFTASSLFYSYFIDRYTIKFDNDVVVIGNKISANNFKKVESLSIEDNEKYIDGAKFHNEKLLEYAGGNAEKVWDHNSINRNKLFLLIFFYSSIITVTCLVAASLQALQLTFIK